MSYISDREFTDKIHNNLAVNIIYPAMGWNVQNINERLQANIDMKNAVDYMAIDQSGKTPEIITIQERFRELKYSKYSDFTIRYMRPENTHEDRRLSEFFKLDADYFIYGIIDTSKDNVDNAEGFIKFAVLNIKILKNLIDDGTVIIDPELNGLECVKEGNVMICPVNQNRDHSSNFVPFDICILAQIAPDVIEYQEGFIS